MVLNQQYKASDLTTCQYLPPTHGIADIQGDSSYQQGHGEFLVAAFEPPHDTFSTFAHTFTSDLTPNEPEILAPFVQIHIGNQLDAPNTQEDTEDTEAMETNDPSALDADIVCFGMVCNSAVETLLHGTNPRRLSALLAAVGLLLHPTRLGIQSDLSLQIPSLEPKTLHSKGK